MTDEYNNDGMLRCLIKLQRGDEIQELEVCADSIEEAEDLARKLSGDEDVLIWENPDEQTVVLDESEILDSEDEDEDEDEEED